MVLPPPPPPPAAVAPALTRLALILEVARGPVLMLIRAASPAALSPVLETVRRDRPDCVVTARTTDLLGLPESSTAVHLLNRLDLGALNLARELLRERRLRVLFVAEAALADTLREEAPDLLDWMSHRLDVSEEPPRWAVANAGAALRQRPGRFAWWGPGDPDAVLARAAPWSVSRASAQQGWAALVAAARVPGWRVWEGVRAPWDEQRVRLAEAVSGSEGAPVLDRPALDLPGWWRVHAEVADIPHERLLEAVAVEHEPEALGLRASVLPDKPEWAVGHDERGEAARLTGPSLRGWAGGVSAPGRWPPLALLGTAALEGMDEHTLADAMRRWPEHAGSYAAAEASRRGIAPRPRIRWAIEAGQLDVARAWIEGLRPESATDRAWSTLLGLLAKEGEGVHGDVAALEALLAEVEPLGERELRAETGFRLAQARFDALDLRGARQALAEALPHAATFEQRFEIEMLTGELAYRMGPVEDAGTTARRLREEAGTRVDEVREARAGGLEANVLGSLGHGADEDTWLREYAPVFRRTLQTWRPWFRVYRSDTDAWAVVRPDRGGAFAALRATDSPLSRASARERALSLDLWSAEPIGLEDAARAVEQGDLLGAAALYLAAGTQAVGRGEARAASRCFARSTALHERAGHRFGATVTRAARAGVEPDRKVALRLLDEAWEVAANFRQGETASRVVAGIARLPGPPDARLPDRLERALELLARYPRGDSHRHEIDLRAWARHALDQSRQLLHRARSMRDEREIRHWRAMERRLRRIVEAPSASQ